MWATAGSHPASAAATKAHTRVAYDPVALPTCQHAGVYAYPFGRLFLREPQYRPALNQTLSPPVRRRLGVVAQKLDDCRHVRKTRLRPIGFPVGDAGLIHAELFPPVAGASTRAVASADDRPACSAPLEVASAAQAVMSRHHKGRGLLRLAEAVGDHDFALLNNPSAPQCSPESIPLEPRRFFVSVPAGSDHRVASVASPAELPRPDKPNLRVQVLLNDDAVVEFLDN